MKQSSIEIVQILQKAGYIAYWAGGCVRDMLLGNEAKDFDIATNARPEEIEKLLKKTYPIGKDFGVILTEQNGHHFEIATFRKEDEYIDGRRPEAVHFCDPKEDALRRDFTINSMFYDPIADKLFDFASGKKDLSAKLIRFIGDPEKRINEDHLRIIRAIRFKNLLKFQYDPKTYQALKEYADLSAKVANERLRDELKKMIESPFFINCLYDMHELRILNKILPELEDMRGVAQPFFYHQEGDVFDHSLKAFSALNDESSFHLKWATLLHDVAKPKTYSQNGRIRFNEHAPKSKEISKQLLQRLAFSKKDIDHITWLTEHHMMIGNLLKMPKGRQRHWFLHPWFFELLELFRVDIAGTDPSIYELYNRIKNSYQDFLNHLQTKNPDLNPFLNGKEIMDLIGMKPGPKLGEIIEHLREKQLAHEIKSKEEAILWLKKTYKNF